MKAYHIETGAGIEYMGIWELEILEKYTSTQPRHRRNNKSGIRYKCIKNKVIWSYTEEHKPQKHPKEPEIVSIAEENICFNQKELNEKFTETIKSIMEDTKMWKHTAISNLNFLIKKIETYEKNISYLDNTLKSLEIIKPPVITNEG